MNKSLFLIVLVHFLFFFEGAAHSRNSGIKGHLHAGYTKAAGPAVNAGPVSGSIFACEGSASTNPNIQQFVVNGSGLTADIKATAPAGFEVSLAAGSGYGNIVTIAQSGGIASNITIYVRSAASALGSISGNVVLSTVGAPNQNVTVNGVVNYLPTVNTIPNQTKTNGQPTDAVNFTGSATIFNWENDRPDIGLPATGTGNIATFNAINAGSSPVTATIKVIPKPAGFAYISNYSSNTISVINTSDNSFVTTIPVGTNPVGVAASKDGSMVYIANNGSNNISVINTATNKVVNTITVGVNPFGIAVSDDGKRVYVVNRGSNTVSAINTATNAVTQIAVGHGPAGIVVTPDGSSVYVTNYDDNSVSCINTQTLQVTNILVAPGPFGIAVSPDGKRVYIANELDDKATIIKTADNSIILLTAIGGQTPHGVAMAPDGNTVYITCAVNNSVLALDPLTLLQKGSFQVGDYPYGVSVSADGNYVYTANVSSRNVSVISTVANAVIGTLPVGLSPYSLGSFTNNSGCTGIPATFTITVNPTAPSIAAGIATGNISACSGSSSIYPNVQQFTVAGNNLSADIVITAPAGFEVSATTASGYAGSITLHNVAGVVANTSVYVRSAATAAGVIAGNVILSSTGITDKSVAVQGIVDVLPTANTVPNQTKDSGQPTDAVTFTGAGNTFTWINDKPSIGLAASGVGDIASFTATNGTGSPVVATITATPHLAPMAYVVNQGDGTVSVVNTVINKVVKTIDLGSAAPGVAISPDGSKVYVPSPGENAIKVISTATNAVTDVITINGYVVANVLMLSPDGKRLYATTESYAILDVNTATNKVETAIPVNTHYPGFFTLSPTGDKIYVLEVQNLVTISTATHLQLGSVAVGVQPSGITISPDGSKLYVTNLERDNVYVVDAQTDGILGTIDVGTIPYYLTFGPDGQTLYVSNFEAGTVSVINTQINKVVNTIPVGVGPIGMSVSGDGSTLYVINANAHSVSVVDVASGHIVNTIDVGQRPTSYGNFITHGGQCSGQPIKFTITVNNNGPAITTSGTLAALTSTYSNPSAASTSFTVSGTKLTAGILIAPPLGFEVSTDNVNFSHTITVGAAGTVVPVTIYVRLAPAIDAGSYSGNIVLTSTGAADATQAVTGIVNRALLTITANTVHKAYGNSLADEPASTAFTPTGLQNSEVIGSVAIAYGLGAAAGDAANTYMGSVIVSAATGGSFKQSNYIITYLAGNIVVDAGPVISFTPVLGDLETTYGRPSAATSFTLAGSSLTAGVLVTPPVGFEVSTDNVNFTKILTVGAAGNIASTTVYVRLTSNTDAGNYPGYIVLSSDGGLHKEVSLLNNTVNKAPLTITANNITKTYGDQLTGGGGFTSFISTGLQNSETVGSIAINYSAGATAVDNVRLYAAAALPANATGGTFKATNYIISYLNGDLNVIKAIVTVAVVNTSKKYGEANPEFAVTYAGFKNQDDVSVLTVLPAIKTPATVLSPVGIYAIKANGAKADNYEFNYVDGILTIEPVKIEIIVPNAFSPNGDGSNDTWQIKNLDAFPGNTVDIFNRYGVKLFSSIGYAVAWDGRYNGSVLPSATYYYIINPKCGKPVIAGYVTILR